MNFVASILQGKSFLPPRLRRYFARVCNCWIDESSLLSPGARLSGGLVWIGPQTFVNVRLLVDGLGKVTIGSRCRIGPAVKLITSTHTITDDPLARASYDATHRDICIGDGVWIGAGSMILPGVSVAKGCVVAAGAVVNKSTAPDGLYAGVPARRVRDLPSCMGVTTLMPEPLAGR